MKELRHPPDKDCEVCRGSNFDPAKNSWCWCGIRKGFIDWLGPIYRKFNSKFTWEPDQANRVGYWFVGDRESQIQATRAVIFSEILDIDHIPDYLLVDSCDLPPMIFDNEASLLNFYRQDLLIINLNFGWNNQLGNLVCSVLNGRLTRGLLTVVCSDHDNLNVLKCFGACKEDVPMVENQLGLLKKVRFRSESSTVGYNPAEGNL